MARSRVGSGDRRRSGSGSGDGEVERRVEEENEMAHEMVRHDLINPALQYAIAPGWIRQSGALGKWRDIQIYDKERNAV